MLKSRSHWKCTSCLQKHMIFVSFYALLLFMLCFHVCTHVCFHLISNVHIVRTIKTRIPIQTFEKWCNVSYSYVSYIKSETSAIWRAGAWVEENHISLLVKSNSTIVTKFFWEMEKPALSEKFQTLTKIFKPKLISSLNLY